MRLWSNVLKLSAAPPFLAMFKSSVCFVFAALLHRSALPAIALALLTLGIPVLAAPRLVGTIDPAPGPDAFGAGLSVHDPVTGRIFILGPSPYSEGRARVQALDATTGEVLAAVESAFSSYAGLALDSAGHRLFVLAQGDGEDPTPLATVFVLSTDTLATLKSVSAATRPAYNLAVNPGTDKAYLRFNYGVVVELDLAAGTERTLQTPSGAFAGFLAVNPVTNTLYGFSTETRTLHVIDPVADTEIAQIPVPLEARQMIVDPAANKIYLIGSDYTSTGTTSAEQFAGRVLTVEGATNTLSSTVIEPSDRLTSAAFDASTNTLYAAGREYPTDESGVDFVYKIDLGTTAFSRLSQVRNESDPPPALTFNPSTGSVLVHQNYSDLDEEQILTINTTTGAPGRITHFYSPRAVAVDPATNRVYLRDSFSPELLVADGASREVIARIPVGRQNGLGDSGYIGPIVGVNSSTGRVYTTSTRLLVDGVTLQNDILVIDAATNEVVAAVPLVTRPSDARMQLVVDESTDRVFVTFLDLEPTTAADDPTTEEDESLVKVDVLRLAMIDANPGSATENTVLAKLKLETNDVYGLAVNPATQRLYITDYITGSDDLTVIDITRLGTSLNPVIATAETGCALPLAIAVNPVTNRLYVTDNNGLRVAVLNGATNAHITDVIIDTPQNPYSDGLFGVAVDSTTNRIYVTDNGKDSRVVGTLSVIDGATNTVTALGIELGATPTHLAVNPVTSHIYTALTTGSTVAVVADDPPSGGGTGPIVTIGPATDITATGAKLNGTIDPNGSSVTAFFEYGTTTSYGQSKMASPAPGSPVPVSAVISGLTANTLYHCRLVATNANGTARSRDVTFTTRSVGGEAPGVTLSATTGISDTEATLNGTIDPKGDAPFYYFEYGSDTSYGQATPTVNTFPGTLPYPVDARLTGLTPKTLYHFRLVATGSSGSVAMTPDATFTTRAPRGDFTVAITGLTNGAVVSPTDEFEARAAVKIPRGSTTRIATVQFFVDGEAEGPPDTKSSYQVDASVSTAGTHTLTAVATDTAGNESESAPVAFKVAEAGAGPIALTSSVSPNGLAIAGDLITFTLAARNSSNTGVKNVEVTLPLPIGTGYVDARFVDDSGQPIAAPKGTTLFFDGATGTVTLQLKEVKAFGSFNLQLLARVPYDQVTTGNTIQSSKFELKATQVKRTFFGTFPTRRVTVAGTLAPNAPRPKLGISITQTGAGELPADKAVVVVTTRMLGVPDVKPERASNEITYRATVFNYGELPAHSVRVVVPVPPGTTYKKKSAGVITAAGDSIPVTEVEFGNLLFFDMPRLEANHPVGIGSAKTLEYTVRVDRDTPYGARITHEGGAVTSGELLTPVTTLDLKVAQVVGVEKMTTEFTRQYVEPAGQPAGSPGGTVFHTVFFHNQSALTAKGVGVRYTVPPGLAFQGADFASALGAPLPLKRGQTIAKPPVGATSGDVTFNVGTVKPGDLGFAQVRLKFDVATRPADTKRSDASYLVFDSSTVDRQGVRTASRLGDGLPPAPPPLPIVGLIPQPHIDLTLSRVFIVQAAPAAIHEGSEFEVVLAWGNLSQTRAGLGAFVFQPPAGTEIISATPATPSFGNPSRNPEPLFNAPGEFPEFPDGSVAWIESPEPNSVLAATVQLRVKSGTTGEIRSDRVRADFDQSVSPIHGIPLAIRLVPAGSQIEDYQAEVYSSSLGQGDGASLGTARTPGGRFLENVKLINSSSRSISIAGADYAHIATNGGIAFPIGANRMVAAGGLNLVDQSTASMVAAGGLNLVAAGGGNMQVEVPGSGLLPGTQLISNVPSLVAAGGMNLVAAGGLNLVRRFDGARLVGMDGSTLVGMDGSTLGTFSQRVGFATSFAPVNAASFNLNANAASMVAAGGGNARIADGGNIFVAGGSNILPPGVLFANEGATVISRDGAGLVRRDGSPLVGQDGSTLVGQDGSTLVGQDGSTMVAAGAGNFISGGTGVSRIIGENSSGLVPRP